MQLRSIAKAKKRRRAGSLLRVNLTSLMDVFCILVFFMLKSYSTEVDVITMSDRLTLPLSSATETADSALKITVSREKLMVEDAVVMDIADVVKGEELLLKPLHDVLGLYRKKMITIGKFNGEGVFRGEVLLQMDRELDFLVLKRIMYTGGQFGFDNIRMMVINEKKIL